MTPSRWANTNITNISVLSLCLMSTVTESQEKLGKREWCVCVFAYMWMYNCMHLYKCMQTLEKNAGYLPLYLFALLPWSGVSLWKGNPLFFSQTMAFASALAPSAPCLWGKEAAWLQDRHLFYMLCACMSLIKSLHWHSCVSSGPLIFFLKW